jgi:thioester reductase-like protein
MSVDFSLRIDEILRLLTPARAQNAWPVNFSMSIASFDPHVGGALNLMNLCLRSPRADPADFYFSSSVSACQGLPDAECAEVFQEAPASAGGTGYARSKWTVERLMKVASERTALRVGVLRIGQMVGDTAKCV